MKHTRNHFNFIFKPYPSHARNGSKINPLDATAHYLMDPGSSLGNIANNQRFDKPNVTIHNLKLNTRRMLHNFIACWNMTR